MLVKVLFWIYVVTLLGIGFVLSKKIKSVDDYYIGGRNVSVIWLGLSFWALMAGSWSFLGGPGVAYEYGVIELINFVAWMPGIAIVAYFLAPVIRRKAEELGAISFSGFVQKAHGGGYSLLALSSILTVLAYIIAMVALVKGVGIVTSHALGMSPAVGTFIGCLIVVIYMLSGGFRAVVLTDVAGFGLLAFVFTVLLVLMFQHGGIAGMAAKASAIDPSLIRPVTGEPYGGSFVGTSIAMVLLWFLYQILPENWPYYFALAKTDKKSIAVFTTIAAIGTCMTAFVVFSGVMARVLLPEGIQLASSDEVLPTLSSMFFPPMVHGLYLIGVFTALITSIDSTLIAVVSNVHDLFEPLYRKSSWSENQKVNFGRLITVVIFGITMLWGITNPPELLVQYLVIGAVGFCAVLAGPAFAYFVRPGTAKGAFSAMLVSAIVLFLLIWFNKLGWIEQTIVAALVSLGVYYGVSALDKTQGRGTEVNRPGIAGAD